MTASLPDRAPAALGDIRIGDREFDAFRQLVYRYAGISLSPAKRYLVQARLARRLRALGLGDFAAYLHYLEGEGGPDELPHFVNALTTNKTDFFREAHHFQYLREQWAPWRRELAARTGDRTVRFWSAGCSTGEEPYTLAMTLLEALDGGPSWNVRILASDIDTEVLGRAAEGMYTLEQIAPVPAPLVPRYFLRGRGEFDGAARIRPAVRSLVTFRRINFLDDPWPIRASFDAIFCRNVLIYFDRPTQQRVLERFVRLLKDEGLLFLGHSESAYGLLDGVALVGNTVYRRS